MREKCQFSEQNGQVMQKRNKVNINRDYFGIFVNNSDKNIMRLYVDMNIMRNFGQLSLKIRSTQGSFDKKGK